ncbi:hypothetical protein BCR44DRAFT_1427282 [Catenaria anguillulae PL171]|uniref:Uncharacterized protein n=1 Tax=Catenaria anguillulae PL171 TaxID=765915 RepID=A0A1Y2HXA8_9FUNG|nr:hypothetical protein BCR44DRAFT_1427282 [Catenaria anguillulae PL171]
MRRHIERHLCICQRNHMFCPKLAVLVLDKTCVAPGQRGDHCQAFARGLVVNLDGQRERLLSIGDEQVRRRACYGHCDLARIKQRPSCLGCRHSAWFLSTHWQWRLVHGNGQRMRRWQLGQRMRDTRSQRVSDGRRCRVCRVVVRARCILRHLNGKREPERWARDDGFGSSAWAKGARETRLRGNETAAWVQGAGVVDDWVE